MNEQPDPDDPIQKAAETKESTSTDLGKQFLWARFQHNRDKLQKNPEFETLFSKQGEWTQDDVETFKSLIGQFKL